MLIDGLISILNNVKKKSKREEFRIKYGIEENDNEYSINDDNNKNNYYISNNNNDNYNNYNNNNNICSSDSNTNCKNDNNDNNDNDNYNRHKSNNLNNITIKEICQCIIKYLFDESLLQNNELKIGTNDIYLYRHEHYQVLQEIKISKLSFFIIKIQKVWRRFVCKSFFKKLQNENNEKKQNRKILLDNKIKYILNCVVNIQKHFRGLQARKVRKFNKNLF